jgi:hypothetical protein
MSKERKVHGRWLWALATAPEERERTRAGELDALPDP